MKDPTEAIAVGTRSVVTFERTERIELTFSGDESFEATLVYEDVAGTVYSTELMFYASRNAYRAIARHRAP